VEGSDRGENGAEISLAGPAAGLGSLVAGTNAGVGDSSAEAIGDIIWNTSSKVEVPLN
jgi:hypothetical protein